MIEFLQRIEMLENLIAINSLKLKSSKEGLDKNNDNSLKISMDIISYGKKNGWKIKDQTY